jgi:CubicO group peptidase (beta-lactamase class C family)
MQCVEVEKLKLEDGASRFIESYPYNEEITVRQLLSHSSGIPNPIPLKWVHPQEEDDQFDQNKFFNETIRSYPRLRSKPGTRFSYSNINYLILGHIIENVTGVNYRDFVRKNIIEKFREPGIYIDFIIKDYSNYAIGYQKKFSWVNAMLGFFLDRKLWIESSSDHNWLRFRKYYIDGSAYGGLISNVQSITTYMKKFFQPGSPLISNDWKKAMLTQQKLSNGENFDMCLGWFMGKCKNHDYYAHPGAGGGYYCEFRYYPYANFISGIMLNRSGIRNEKLLDQVDPFFL